MRYAFVFPGGDPHTCAQLATEAEAAGWDGVFVPDSISIDTPGYPPAPAYDPWITLAAMAVATRRVRLGTMITPLPRRRAWKLAQEAVTLDHLASGRVILAAGLGAANDDAGFYKVGEAMHLRLRAELLDEGLDILAGLWKGRPFTFEGKHYRIQGMTLLPTPVQSPRIPVWVVGVWPRPLSMARASKWDGIVVQKSGGPGESLTPADIVALKAYCNARRSGDSSYDVVVEGQTPGSDLRAAAAATTPFAEAGATWWIESMWTPPNGPDEVLARLRKGPPDGRA
ncbi:MAG: LLM class flavin-dependent oxidoreductase [Chloroflexi bacterium]|nr:LLM class flavin-dependent oxidoreductase [Chloroflexota bacterium]